MSGITTKRAGRTVTLTGDNLGDQVLVNFSSTAVPSWDFAIITTDFEGNFILAITTPLSESGVINASVAGFGLIVVNLPATVGILTVNAVTSANYVVTGGVANERKVTITGKIETYDAQALPTPLTTGVEGAPDYVSFDLLDVASATYQETVFSTDAVGNFSKTLQLPFAPLPGVDQFWKPPGRTLRVNFRDGAGTALCNSVLVTIAPAVPLFSSLDWEFAAPGPKNLRLFGVLSSIYCEKQLIIIRVVGSIIWKAKPSNAAYFPYCHNDKGQPVAAVPDWEYVLKYGDPTVDAAGNFSFERGDGQVENRTRDDALGFLYVTCIDCWNNRCLSITIDVRLDEALTSAYISQKVQLATGFISLAGAARGPGSLKPPPQMTPPAVMRPPPAMTMVPPHLTQATHIQKPNTVNNLGVGRQDPGATMNQGPHTLDPLSGVLKLPPGDSGNLGWAAATFPGGKLTVHPNGWQWLFNPPK